MPRITVHGGPSNALEPEPAVEAVEDPDLTDPAPAEPAPSKRKPRSS